MDGLERAAEAIAPEIKVPVMVVKIAIAAIVLTLAGFVIWKVFFAGHAAQVKHDVVQAQGKAAISDAGAKAGAAAIPIIVKNFNSSAAIDAQTQEAIREALKAPGAKQTVDPALDALGRRAICMRASAASLSECESVLHPSP